MQPRPKTIIAAPARRRRLVLLETFSLKLALSVLALLVAPAILRGNNLPAQTNVQQATKLARQQRAAAKPAHPRRPAAHAHAASTPNRSAPEAIAAQPPASSDPICPADQPPDRARVSWGSRGLTIEASNSSLNQILRQVAADTGAKLQVLTQDQRVFGNYGPGPASDVLLKLLNGSGYNVLILGGRDAEPPLEIVLSARSPASPQTAANNQNSSNSENDEVPLEPDQQADDPTEQPRPQPPDPFATGTPTPHDPAQLMQEILQRQQKIDQQQQEQQNDPQQ